MCVISSCSFSSKLPCRVRLKHSLVTRAPWFFAICHRYQGQGGLHRVSCWTEAIQPACAPPRRTPCAHAPHKLQRRVITLRSTRCRGQLAVASQRSGQVSPSDLSQLDFTEKWREGEWEELGHVWKVTGIQGQVVIRVRVSLEDGRPGVPGTRYICLPPATALNERCALADVKLAAVQQLRGRQAEHKGHIVWVVSFAAFTDRQASLPLIGCRLFMRRTDADSLTATSAHPVTGLPLVSSPEHPPPNILSFAVHLLPSAPNNPLHHFHTDDDATQAPASISLTDVSGSNGSCLQDGAPSASMQQMQRGPQVGIVGFVMHDTGEVFDTGAYVDAQGFGVLPGGPCDVIEVSFLPGLVMNAAAMLLPDVADVAEEELLQAPGAEALIPGTKQVEGGGAKPRWERYASHALLPLSPRYVAAVDYVAEVVTITPPSGWLMNHLGIRMVKQRAPRRTEKALKTMGNKLAKRKSKAFIKRKGKYASKGRNMRKT